MTESAYPVARVAAFRVHRHFELLAPGHTPLPDLAMLETILHVAFWASLRREESATPRVSLAMVAPEFIQRPMRFASPVALTPESLTRIAPGVNRAGVHLGVSGAAIWGTSHLLPPFCLIVEIIAPGLLVIKYSGTEAAGKFVNIAVIEGDQLKVIDQRAASIPDCPAMLPPLLGLESQFRNEAGPLIQLAVSMRAHGRGGTLLVVPVGRDDWRESIMSPIPYAVTPAFATLPTARDIDVVAGLTAADGATILNEHFEVLGFGAKIVRRWQSPFVTQVTLSEPIEGAVPTVVEPMQLGGTRHSSAAQFTHDQQDSLAMVASQDGRFTLFGWSPCDGMVHARRVESLLL